METTTTTEKKLFTPEEFDSETSEIGRTAMTALAYAFANILISSTPVTRETILYTFRIARDWRPKH